jgi:arabinan endo-1,5-alpha-L-arabinosidase
MLPDYLNVGTSVFLGRLRPVDARAGQAVETSSAARKDRAKSRMRTFALQFSALHRRSPLANAAMTVAMALWLQGGAACAAEPQPKLTGDLRIHDPSVVEVDGKDAAFGTGEPGLYRGAIRVKTSEDGLRWTDAGAIGKGVPSWGKETLGYQPTNVWAPSISRRGHTFFLYYSLSSFGVNASAIGLMTDDAFDPAKPGEGWRDQGLVLKSDPRDDFNAIDPFRIDLPDGRAFLSFGSYWSGIKLVALNPETGKLSDQPKPPIALASRNGGAVEASSILAHNGKYYLFVSFDQCCKGVASTYNVRVGRADRIEGPYRDRDGKDMRDGGGSMLLAAGGRFIGPGGQEPVETLRGEMLAYHYYDAEEGGVAKLQLSPIDWGSDGWPTLEPFPQ